MNRRWWLKLGMIGGLILLLLLPLSALRGLVVERQWRGQEVAADIAASSSRSQQLLGPLLVIDATATLRHRRVVTENGVMREVEESVKEPRRLVVAPQSLSIGGDIATERRGRGIFTALLYHSELDFDAAFALPEPPVLEGDLLDYRLDRMRLLIAVGDSRGISSSHVTVDGMKLAAEPAESAGGWISEGIQIVLPKGFWSKQAVSVTAELGLTGTDTLSVVPIGDESTVALAGEWPHPGFTGAHLPIERTVSEAGFNARWQVSRLASRAQQALQECHAASTQCDGFSGSALAVRLVDPVDRYLLTERALKYGLLFLVILFGAVFLLEALRNVEVHPLQYGLTGLAMATFFLLLLALSEHLAFGLAYALASISSVALIAAYMSAVLGGRSRGLAFAGLLALLYALLFGVLQSEDYALLLGAVTLFALLASVMLATRHLDWSRAGAASKA